MTQTITTVDLIRRSMYLISAVAAGEMPDTSDLNDALITLNEMIDGWNLQPMAVYGKATESFVLTPSQGTYNWGLLAGPTGIETERPVWLKDCSCVRNGFTTAVEVITQEQYDDISLKDIESPLVERVLYVNSFPFGILTCFPVPSEANTLVFNVARQIAGPLTLQDTIALPPGYQKAIRYNLAVDLWPEYANSSTDIESVKKIAKEAFGKIKVANDQVPPSTFGDIPGVDINRSWDWRGSN